MKEGFLFIFALTVAIISNSAVAAKSGTCGTLEWTLDGYALTISGTGDLNCKICRINDLKYISSVVIEDGCTSIADNVFSSCTSLWSAVLANTITSIGDHAFSDCPRLNHVNISASVTELGTGVFSGCSGLNNINVDDNNPALKSEDGILYNKNMSQLICSPADGSFESIPNSVTSLADFAFSSCKLKELTIPDSVSSIGFGVFANCSLLENTTVSDSNKHFKFDKGFLTNKDGSVLYFYPEFASSVTIPDSVRTIVDYTFYKHQLTSVDFGDKVESIGSYAFYGCNKLDAVEIPDSVTYAGPYAFSSCNNLVSVKLGDGLTSIENYTFSSNKKLNIVTIGEKVTAIGSVAFDSCGSLEYGKYEAGLYLGTKTNRFYALYKPQNQSITELKVHEDTKIITEFSFRGLGYLATLILSDGVKSIGQYAFKGCDAITTLDLGNGLEIINQFAFDGCSGWVSLVIPDSVTYIGAYAFRTTRSVLNSVKIGNKVKFIGTYAFHNLRVLKEIAIPDSVETIEESAFNFCSGVENITIGKGLSSLGRLAFVDTSSLKSLTVDPSNSHFKTVDNCLYDINGKDLIMCAAQTPSVKIENTVTTIHEHAFQRCIFKTLTIPASVTSIGDYIFLFSKVEEIKVESGNSEFKSSGGFLLNKDGTVLLKAPPKKDVAIIPGCVTEIATMAFYCSETTRVVMGDNVVSIGDLAFYNSDLLEEASLGKVSIIGSDAFSDCKVLRKVCYFGDSDPEKNSTKAFIQVPKLSSVTVPLNYKDSQFCSRKITKADKCEVEGQSEVSSGDGSDGSSGGGGSGGGGSSGHGGGSSGGGGAASIVVVASAAELKATPSNLVIMICAWLTSTMLFFICKN